MTQILDTTPVIAAAFAIPQFLPQLRKLHTTNDCAGISWTWATMTSVNNAAWFAYFLAAHDWTALMPATSATTLAAALSAMLAARGGAVRRTGVVIAAILATGYGAAGVRGLDTLLSAAFVMQVTPSIWSAFRTRRPTGISATTWLLILGELCCWLVFGLHKSDPRLIVLGISGVTAAVAMLARLQWTTRPGAHGTARSISSPPAQAAVLDAARRPAHRPA